MNMTETPIGSNIQHPQMQVRPRLSADRAMVLSTFLWFCDLIVLRARGGGCPRRIDEQRVETHLKQVPETQR